MKLNKIIKGIAIAAVTLTSFGASAQGLKVVTKDGKSVNIPYADLDYVGVYGEPEYVDLGLSVKWATFNVGATSPEEPGRYFMWAGVDDSEDIKYNKLAVPYQDPAYADPDNFIDYFTRYCNTTDAGIPDYRSVLEPEDDAANTFWGDDWRMPTAEEVQELLNNTTVEKLAADNEEYGIAGYKFTAANGNSIFLPCGGYRYLTKVYSVGSDFYYWTASLYTPSCLYANAFKESGYGANKTVKVDYQGRYYGCNIRPVYAGE